MKNIIRGKKYNFKIGAGNNYFYIQAKHKSTGRFSCINNLNAILSELDVEADDAKYQDSWWTIPKNEVRKFKKVANEILSDIKFRKYLEHKLDEDREYGEWENIQKIRSESSIQPTPHRLIKVNDLLLLKLTKTTRPDFE